MFQHFLLQLHILCNFSFGILCAAVAFPSIVFAMNPLYLCVCLLATFTVRTQYSLFIVKINGTAYKIDKTYCVVSWIVCTKHIEHWTVRKRLMPICLINNNKNLFFFFFSFSPWRNFNYLFSVIGSLCLNQMQMHIIRAHIQSFKLCDVTDSEH